MLGAGVISPRRLDCVPENDVVDVRASVTEESVTCVKLLSPEQETCVDPAPGVTTCVPPGQCPEPVTKAEPVTASQQISLWIWRNSSQDVTSSDWSAMGSIRNIISLGVGHQRHDHTYTGHRDVSPDRGLRKCATDVKFSIESDDEDDNDEECDKLNKQRANKTKEKLLKQLKKGKQFKYPLLILYLKFIFS